MRVLPVSFAILTLGCGAKTGLEVPDNRADGGLRDAPAEVDTCIELPPREPPREAELSFVTRISSADVLFLVDVTGSMGDEIRVIQSRLQDTIVPGIDAALPDVHFAVARFADFPVDPYGDPDQDELFVVQQSSIPGVMRTQAALNELFVQNGADGPEASVEALYLSVRNEAVPPWVRMARCSSGVGHACLRRDRTPIIMLFTDAEMHNGPGGANPYVGIRGAHTYEETVAALRETGSRVLGFFSGDFAGDAELRLLARDTGAVDAEGDPIVFNIGFDGSGLGPAVVDAVRTVVNETPIARVGAEVEDVPGDALDATEFVTAIETIAAEPPSGALQRPGDFGNVRPGTRVRFRIRLANERIERGPEPIRYLLRGRLVGDGATLTETVVGIVIPSIDDRGC